MFDSIISSADLEKILGQDHLIVMDCRFSLADPEEGHRAFERSHIPGAVYAHLDNDLTGEIIPGKTGRHPLPTVEAFAQTLSAWGINKQTQVVAYDQIYGGIASRLWWMLKWVGHQSVAVLDGGWMHWKANNHPTTNKVYTPNPSVFEATPNDKLIVSSEEISQQLENPHFLLIDARAEERFKGEEEPIDPIAGHIPGAVSAPFIDNMNYAGTFHSKSELRDRFDDLLTDAPEREAVFYCGSGVTACHNILSHYYANSKMAKLYPGSWSEWITDEKKPIATA